MPAEKTCFVIAPIGPEDSETRRRSDQVLEYVIKPPVMECGYAEPERADQMDKPGTITSQVVERVMNADLVIADLAESNANVFYELAIRHAIRKAVVQIVDRGSSLPFDVASTRTIRFDHHDLASVAEAKKRIAEQIRAAEQSPADADTPLTAAIDLQSSRASDEPQTRLLGEMMAQLREMRSDLAVVMQQTKPAARRPVGSITDLLTEYDDRWTVANTASLPHPSSLLSRPPALQKGLRDVIASMESQRIKETLSALESPKVKEMLAALESPKLKEMLAARESVKIKKGTKK